MVPVSSYAFDGGILESDPGRYRLTKEDVGETRLSVAAYLIAHPRGVLLWDTGAVPDGEWTPTGQPVAQRLVLADASERRVTIRASLASQLAAAGYKAGDVTHLALSHYHWDHTANANDFAGSTWLRPGWSVTRCSSPSLLAPCGPPVTPPRERQDVVLKDDEHDVFGDGTVILIRQRHTPGTRFSL